MSIPVWAVLAFAAWTIAILMLGVGVYRWSLILTGNAELKSFPGDEPHGSPFYRRAVRGRAVRREPAGICRDRARRTGGGCILTHARRTVGRGGCRPGRADERASLFGSNAAVGVRSLSSASNSPRSCGWGRWSRSTWPLDEKRRNMRDGVLVTKRYRSAPSGIYVSQAVRTSFAVGP